MIGRIMGEEQALKDTREKFVHPGSTGIADADKLGRKS